MYVNNLLSKSLFTIGTCGQHCIVKHKNSMCTDILPRKCVNCTKKYSCIVIPIECNEKKNKKIPHPQLIDKKTGNRKQQPQDEALSFPHLL